MTNHVPSLIELYQHICVQKGYEKNAYQIKVLEDLQTFSQDIAADSLSETSTSSILDKGMGLFSYFFKSAKLDIPPMPVGIYIYGGVGRGKSMLMDLFYSYVPVARKKRVHFIEFMRDVHKSLKDLREKNIEQPILMIADQISEQYQLICFDEFQVLDITDAMLLGRLFQALIERGVRFVITSNRPPDDLYLNGLNRQLFLPFIATLKEKFTIIPLQHDKDYRQQRLKDQNRYIFPLNHETHAEFEEIWGLLTRNKTPAPLIIQVSGRELVFEKTQDIIGWIDFNDLCDKPLASQDYAVLAEHIKILLLDHIPSMTSEMRNQATRFRHLIDVYYEAKNMIFFRSAVQETLLYAQGDYSFEFERTLSRIQEMQAKNYAVELSTAFEFK